jgi:prepilin-type N-terminal cleavage/methylation domain-containing protein
MVRIFEKDKKNSGFTLLELVIVFAMLSIILATLTINFKSGSSSLSLQRVAFKLSTDIRRTQAAAGIQDSACCTPSCHTDYKYGYGINFDLTGSSSDREYYLFSDCNGDNKYNQGTDGNSKKTIQIEKGVKVCGLYKGINSVNKVDVVFLPPDPFVFVDGLKANDPVTIKICLENDITKTKDVVINRVGMIEIK